MSDREFIVEIKRGVVIILRAMIRRYGLSWLDFLPREAVTVAGIPVGWVVVDETVK